MKEPGRERRKFKRFDSPMELEYRTLTQNPIYGSAKAADISKGGISFHHEKEMGEGSQVELKMNVPGDNIPIFATGTVSWASGPKAGVKITRIAKLDQNRIFEYIYSHWIKVRNNGSDRGSNRRK